MNLDKTRQLIDELLADIAPEAQLDDVRDEEDLRAALDIDSMDFLNLIIAMHERTGVEIPEADYPRLYSLKGIAEYLGEL